MGLRTPGTFQQQREQKVWNMDMSHSWYFKFFMLFFTLFKLRLLRVGYHCHVDVRVHELGTLQYECMYWVLGEVNLVRDYICQYKVSGWILMRRGRVSICFRTLSRNMKQLGGRNQNFFMSSCIIFWMCFFFFLERLRVSSPRFALQT